MVGGEINACRFLTVRPLVRRAFSWGSLSSPSRRLRRRRRLLNLRIFAACDDSRLSTVSARFCGASFSLRRALARLGPVNELVWLRRSCHADC